ncbi:hypothetical protein ACWEQL_21380 [Kitasatospora sp. NPDC004240]
MSGRTPPHEDGADGPDTFDRIADELYALLPGEFTAARNRHAGRLRKTDPRLAEQVRALHRPAQAAWAANLLAHRHPDLVARLLDLGESLRDAQRQLAGERLRPLVEQRRQLVRALAEQAQRAAAEAGHPLAVDAVEGLERTLGAALSDPEAATALAAGRLTAPLEPVLWPDAGPGGPEGDQGEDVVAGTRPGPARTAAATDPTAAEATAEHRYRHERERARELARERALERARELARGRALERAREAVAETEAAVREAAESREAAERALADAESDRRRAREEAKQADRALTEAQRRADRTRRSLARAEERVRTAREGAHAAGDRAREAREAAEAAAGRMREAAGDGDGAGPD